MESPNLSKADMLAVKRARAQQIRCIFDPHTKEIGMNKRGKVLRDPHGGPGLLMIEGRQYQFWLDTWTLDIPPKPGLPVEVTCDGQDQIQRIGPVSALEIEDQSQQRATTLRRTLWSAVKNCFH